jgi:hypothetical protein
MKCIVENDICSNSVHACAAEDVLDCFTSESLGVDGPKSPGGTIVALSKSNAFANPSPGAMTTEDNDKPKAKLPVVTWRTIIPSGKAPQGRYYHSTTHIQSMFSATY